MSMHGWSAKAWLPVCNTRLARGPLGRAARWAASETCQSHWQIIMKISYSVARHKAHKRLFRESKGRFGARKKPDPHGQGAGGLAPAFMRIVTAAIANAISAPFGSRGSPPPPICTACGTGNSFHGLELAQIGLNRKSLSELAIHEPAVFAEIASVVRQALASAN